jgi:hypothetical protein
MAKLPIASVTRLLRNAGAERVSEDASVALVEILEAEGEKIAAKAVSLAKHAGRKTVKRKDRSWDTWSSMMPVDNFLKVDERSKTNGKQFRENISRSCTAIF